MTAPFQPMLYYIVARALGRLPRVDEGYHVPEISTRKTVVVGGGPAGLTAAYDLVKAGRTPLVFEASDQVGGIARTESYKGYRFDIGGHRFFTKVKRVDAMWHEVLDEEFIQVPRMSRIYYGGKYYDYPLKLTNTLRNLGVYESSRILLSYLKWRVKPHREEDTFEQWVMNRFGGRLYWHFFRTYTEKVWGIPCTEIRADWAAQRIKNLSLKKAVVEALTGSNDTTSLIKTFEYPRLGPGQMWEVVTQKVEERGGEVRMQSPVTAVHREENRVTGVSVRDTTTGETYRVDTEHVINSMPITLLIKQIDPPPPREVIDAAGRLKYRDFLIVALILEKEDLFPDNWIYIHSPEVKVGRIQNFRSWSAAMVPDPTKASIGMEYFCHRGDGLWNSDDADLIELAKKELAQLGLADPADVVDGTVVRQPMAYPVYDEEYKANLEVVRRWLGTLEGLQTVGRNGMHRYNNQDHSMLTAMLAVENILGADHDLWDVNVERSYHEDFVTKDKNRDGNDGTGEGDTDGGKNNGDSTERVSRSEAARLLGTGA